MVGEHGGSSVVIWSSISVGRMPAFKSLCDSHSHWSFDEVVLEGIRRAMVGGAYEVIGLKGYTSWAIGYSVASLTASLLRD
jgi:L-lactate dehydrogenase